LFDEERSMGNRRRSKVRTIAGPRTVRGDEGLVWIAEDFNAPVDDDFRVDPAVDKPTALKRIRGVRPRRAVDVVRVLREDRDRR
jgi:hypothetical protein